MSEAAAQHAMACIALGFTPRVALLDEAVLMEVSGSLRLFGGLVRLHQLLAQRLQYFFESNQTLRQVIRAHGATSLIALARLRLLRQHCDAAKTRVAELPMHTLTAVRPHLGVLERTGCRSWGDLVRLPRDGLARRFGAPLLEALDRARGALPDNYAWLTLPEQFDEKLELDALVIQAPALMAGVAPLLVQLQAWLLGRQSGLSAFKLIWHLDKRRFDSEHLPPTGELVIRTAQPAQDLRHVARLVAEQLGQVHLPAPVHSITLQSLETEPLVNAAAATSSLLMEAHERGDSAAQLIERLSARLGQAQVCVWQPQADHRPEQMQRWVPAQGEGKGRQQVTIKSIASSPRISCRSGLNSLQNSANEALYPTWLLLEPLHLAAVAGRPVYQGPLVRLAGPQRLEATGWLMRHDPASGSATKPVLPAIRDYFIYRSQQAGLLWIYSERLAVTPESAGQRAWYLHGFFA
jgi:protein ImuB